MSNKFKKDPDALLDYVIDWSEWLAGDKIVESTWYAEDGITIEVGYQFTDTTTTVWLSGGEVGCRYKVTNKIETAGGRIDERTIIISISQH